ncbi:sensor histidine kinase [Stenomitos frigidus]|uniref:sensor histidine kinase n=1 Tax=Stenomitos frigidus TaxID=1886765 RepID=UPI001C627753|nr:hypothetical protein [Stenomitos frigidus]
MELDCTAISVTHLCQSSLAFVKQQALQKRIQLQVKLPSSLPDLLVDERRIRQVLINLLNNAVKFTPDGGGVTLEAAQGSLEYYRACSARVSTPCRQRYRNWYLAREQSTPVSAL